MKNTKENYKRGAGTVYTVSREVKEAYADCLEGVGWEEGEKRRNLSFKASRPVFVSDAIDIFTKNFGKDFGYNEFEPSLLKHLGKDTLITIAREGSVCVYAYMDKLTDKKAEQLWKKLKADEFDYCEDFGKDSKYSVKGAYRIWFD